MISADGRPGQIPALGSRKRLANAVVVGVKQVLEGGMKGRRMRADGV